MGWVARAQSGTLPAKATGGVEVSSLGLSVPMHGASRRSFDLAALKASQVDYVAERVSADTVSVSILTSCGICGRPTGGRSCPECDTYRTDADVELAWQDHFATVGGVRLA